MSSLPLSPSSSSQHTSQTQLNSSTILQELDDIVDTDDDLQTLNRDTLSQSDLLLLDEIRSEHSYMDDQIAHQTFMRNEILDLKQLNSKLYQELYKVTCLTMTLSMGLDKRFSEWLKQYRDHQTRSVAQLITTTSLILSELQKINTDSLHLLNELTSKQTGQSALILKMFMHQQTFQKQVLKRLDRIEDKLSSRDTN